MSVLGARNGLAGQFCIVQDEVVVEFKVLVKHTCGIVVGRRLCTTIHTVARICRSGVDSGHGFVCLTEFAHQLLFKIDCEINGAISLR